MAEKITKFDDGERSDVAPRRMAAGRSYVYILPCRDDTLLKIGFSRDPLQRFASLHPRYFEFFDLDRGALLETDCVRDARRIERHFLTMFGRHGAPAPLVVPKAAAGHTEWYRGVHDEAIAAAGAQSLSDGYALHMPLTSWLRTRLGERSDLLFDWSGKAFEMAEFERFNLGIGEYRRGWGSVLRDVLDAYESIGLPVASLVPQVVLDWYRNVGDES